MNVDRRWMGTSVVRVRVLLAVLVLFGAGCMLLGWGSRSRRLAANEAAAAQTPALQSEFSPSMLAGSQNLPAHTQIGPSQTRSLLAGLPLMFEPNRGQANLDPSDRRAQFVARGSGYSLYLGSDGAILNLNSRVSSQQGTKHSEAPVRVESLHMKLAGANPHAELSAMQPLPGKSNYLLGSNPANWRHDIPQFARVGYENVYPGINLVFYGNQGRLEYDFQVAPGSDPKQAELEFDGAKGVDLVDGALIVKGETGSVRLDPPRIYQEIAGRQQPVDGSFVLRGNNRAGFAIGNYDHARELVIDPYVSFATYFGGTGDEHATSVAVDGSGYIYLTGSTTSPALAASGTLQTTLNGTQNLYILKILPAQGSNTPVLSYITYLGGGGIDSPVGISVDGAGDPYVAGTTTSTDFPTTITAYQTAPETPGNVHTFVTELNTTATALVYSSYLSGNATDTASGMTIDSKGYIYVTGTTTSNDVSSTSVQFPSSGLPEKLPYQNFPRAPIQFFVTKVNTAAPRTGSIDYSTYFGGGNFVSADPIAIGGGIAVDTNGNIYFTGTTNFTYTGCVGCQTTDFPILNAYQPCLDQVAPTVVVNPATCTDTTTTANPDAFVAKLNPNAAQGAQLLWSTYVGGSQSDYGNGIALDTGAANVYIVGTTNSPDVTSLLTFAGFQLCLDSPTTAVGTACPNNLTTNDAFVARLTNPATTTTTITNMALTYFSYLGGSADEAGQAIVVDNANGAVVTGWTQSTDFPVFPLVGDIQSQLDGPQDAFVARLFTSTTTGQNTTGSWSTYFGGNGTDQGTGVALDVNQNPYFAGDTTSTADLHVTAFQTTNAGGYDAFVTQLASASSLSLIGKLTLGTNQSYISAGNQATFTYTLTNSGPDLASGITITDDLANTGQPVTFVSAAATSGNCTTASTSTGVSCTITSLQAGSTATITIVLTPTGSNDGTAASFNGGTVTANAANNITPVQTSVPAQMSDFTLASSPSNQTIAAGQTAPYQVVVTPHPVYGSAISLTASGLPSGATANFTTASLTLPGTGPGSSTLNIVTTARPIVTPLTSSPGGLYSLWLFVPGFALLGLGTGSKRNRRRIAGTLMLFTLFALIAFQPACSKTTTTPPVSGTPAGDYPITITASSGSDTKSATVFLNVQ